MSIFKKTTHLSEIIEESEKNPVTIFIHSNDCNASSSVENEIIGKLQKRTLRPIIYMVTVQTEPVLSKKIEEWFNVKHESPQIITILKGKVIYTDHHKNIKIDKFID